MRAISDATSAALRRTGCASAVRSCAGAPEISCGRCAILDVSIMPRGCVNAGHLYHIYVRKLAASAYAPHKHDS